MCGDKRFQPVGNKKKGRLKMKKIISFAMCLTLIFTSLSAFAFTDTEDHWAIEYITKLSDKGIIRGYEDGSFRPETNITKAEFATMVQRAFSLSGEKEYADVKGHWAEEYIKKSVEFFYNPQDIFEPDKQITRGEVAFVFSGILNLPKAEGDFEISDIDAIDENMKDKILSCVGAGLLKGYEDSSLRVSNLITRAEVSALIVRAMEYKTPETPVVPEKPENTDTNHIYTLYPLKDIFMVKSVTRTHDASTGEELVKLTYSLSSDADKIYTSLIPEDNDIEFTGLRASISDLEAGDLFIFDTGFLGHISTLATLATLSSDTIHTSVPDAFAYGTGAKYEFIAGTVTQYDKKTKTMVLTLENLFGTYEISVPLKANAVAYRESGDNKSFKAESVSYIEVGTYVFVRYTDGVCTDIIMKQ